MRNLLLGLLLGLCLPLGAAQLSEPPPLPAELREVYLYFKEIEEEFNNIRVTTTNPNGNIQCTVGDLIDYNNGGSHKLCLCTAVATTWRCNANALTAP